MNVSKNHSEFHRLRTKNLDAYLHLYINRHVVTPNKREKHTMNLDTQQ